jgi:hypothetical protein
VHKSLLERSRPRMVPPQAKMAVASFVLWREGCYRGLKRVVGCHFQYRASVGRMTLLRAYRTRPRPRATIFPVLGIRIGAHDRWTPREKFFVRWVDYPKIAPSNRVPAASYRASFYKGLLDSSRPFVLLFAWLRATRTVRPAQIA